VEDRFSITLRGTRLERQRWLTLALSGGAAVASAKPAGNMIGLHYGEPASGPVRFNALLADARAWWLKRERRGWDMQAASPRGGRAGWGRWAPRPRGCCGMLAGPVTGPRCVTP
jgi:hypothetical protein